MLLVLSNRRLLAYLDVMQGVQQFLHRVSSNLNIIQGEWTTSLHVHLHCGSKFHTLVVRRSVNLEDDDNE